MAILNETEARAILEKVMGLSQAEECEANLYGGTSGNIRYALNTVTTSGVSDDTTLVVQSSYGKRSATATVNEFDPASLEKVVRKSEELAKLAPENPEYMKLVEPQEYGKSSSFFEKTAKLSPDFRTQAAANSIGPSRKKNLVAAGFLEDEANYQAMMNSTGLFAYHKSTGVDFSVTVRTEDGSGSGWATRDFNDASLLDTEAASNVAIEKAERSVGAKAIEPGKYTVVLEPAASVQLLQNMLFNFDRRQAEEGRSFLSDGDEKTKLGQKLYDERVNIYSDPAHPDVPVSPWDSSGRARKKTYWIRDGVVENMPCSRYWAHKQGYESLPFPANGIMAGGDATTEELIKSTRKGILVTRLWYIRTVDPQTLLYTGLTRDGTFYIENGKLAYPIKNFRFNESPVIMLNNLEAMGTPQRINGNMVPPLKIRDFTFSSLSDAV